VADGGLISVEAARAAVLDGLRATPAELVALSEGWGRVLAQDVVARRTSPPDDVSAMDGYALRAADGHAGAVLRVVGEAPAGHPWAGTVDAGEAVRLFTGSVVPAGADTVLLQEDATREGGSVRVDEAAEAARHIRRAGQDFAAGDVVLRRGQRLGARDVGLAAAADSVAGHDLLVTIGGASVGDHDLVHAALSARGMRTGFWRVAMRPGKPLMSGRLGDVAVLGLPGNPVSSLVCSVLFLLPALRVLLGGAAGGPPVARARLGVAVRANDHRADHLRASLEDGADGLTVTPFAVQDSAMLAALARADALLVRAPHAPALEAGAEAEVIRLDGLGL